MPTRDFHLTEAYAEQLERHAAYKAEIISMMRAVREDPEHFPSGGFGRRRRVEHNNPGLVLFFTVSPVDGSITFQTLIGPNTPLEP